MAISFIGQSSAGSNTASLPGGISVGDFILIFAYRNTTTAPSLGSGYTSIVTSSGNSNSYRVGYRIATGSDSFGTWTNANVVNCVVYRGVSRIGKTSAATGAASTTTAIPTITLQLQDSSSWVAAFAGSKQTAGQGTPLAGATQSRGTQTGTTSDTIWADTNAGVSSFSATTSSNGTSVTNSGGSIELVANGTSITSFSDPFNQTSLDTSKWVQTTGGSGTMSYTAVGAVMTFPVSSTSSTVGSVNSISAYDLTGSSTYVQVTSTPLSSTSADGDLALYINDTLTGLNSTNYLRWVIEAGTLYAQSMINTVKTNQTSFAFNAVTHAWWRIREASGTTYWDTSVDGSSWTNRASVANPIVVTALQVLIDGHCFQNETSPGTFSWLDFDTTGSVSASVTQVTATLTFTGGTQAIATVNNSTISQAAASLTFTGGTQVIQTNSTISQTAATLTFTGGTQAVATIRNVSISQSAATLTFTGGTQTVTTFRQVNTSQSAATLTFTGGTQSVQSIQNVQVSQTAATLTFNGGIQSVSSVQNASISQVAANLTFTGGSQSLNKATVKNNFVWLTDGTPSFILGTTDTSCVQLLDGRRAKKLHNNLYIPIF